MVSTRGSRRTNEEKLEEKTDGGVEERKGGNGTSSKSSSEAGFAADYEEKRAQRMKENMERMKKLGILDLSKQLKQERVSHKKGAAAVSTLPAFNDPPRRSSRLKTKNPISYSEIRSRKEEKVKKNVEICIKAGSRPEVYTEEQEKLLGDSRTNWTLFFDGYDGEGKRIYDPFLGKCCHQCRQKTLGHHTNCSKCKLKSRQFCGDCLYMRYGENVIEANENPNWICPVCRGICNCSHCRRKNGWAPTGLIYKKVKSLGFKSVAHYLIQTFRSASQFEEPASKSTDSANASLSNADEKNDSSIIIPVPVHDNDKQLGREDEFIGEGSSGDGYYNDE